MYVTFHLFWICNSSPVSSGSIYLLIWSNIFKKDFIAFLHIVSRSSCLLQWNFHKQAHSLIADLKNEVKYMHRKTKIVLRHRHNDVGSFINLWLWPCGHLADLKMVRHEYPTLKLSILFTVLCLAKEETCFSNV